MRRIELQTQRLWLRQWRGAGRQPVGALERGPRVVGIFSGPPLATEAARAALHAGFEEIALNEVVSFTSVLNVRSRAVMERVGMQNTQKDFDYPGIPQGHMLRPHCLYRIT